MGEPKILTIDIETFPNLAYVWGLFKQNIYIDQVAASHEVCGFAAKWHDSDEVQWFSNHHDGHRKTVQAARRLLDQADVVVHYNGKSFDIPHLQREIALAGIPRPSPFKQVDLLETVKKQFRFASNKLDFVVQEFGLGKKVEHEGFPLWVKCMAGDQQAWEDMRDYCKHDVVLEEKLYDHLLPWIDNHPHRGLYVDSADPMCSRCGSTKLQRRGVSYTALSAFQRYQCQGCGGWSRGARRVNAVSVRGDS